MEKDTTVAAAERCTCRLIRGRLDRRQQRDGVALPTLSSSSCRLRTFVSTVTGPFTGNPRHHETLDSEGYESRCSDI